MQKNNRTILSTRPLKEELIKIAADHSIVIDCISFIETEPVKTKAIEDQIHRLESKNITAVFTSMNAVDAVTAYLTTKPSWNIYCIGHTTKELIEKAFGRDAIKATANSASLLAEEIIKQNEKDVYFFCGDQRRDELPKKLKQEKIDIKEIVVYQTRQEHKKIDKHYDGVLFFSPSAVESFFSSNILNIDAILFAIGDTTANEIKRFAQNKIVVANQPGKENLVEKMIAHFGTVNKQIN